MTHPHFEFVADASDDFDALQAFSRQFDNEDEMHEYSVCPSIPVS